MSYGPITKAKGLIKIRKIIKIIKNKIKKRRNWNKRFKNQQRD